jgi:hypothetical protein
MLLLLVGLGMVLQFYFGGLVTLETEIDESQQEEYRRAVVLENLLNAEYSTEEVTETSSFYDFDRRRAILPIEFFVNEDPADGELGYETNDGHCYIPRVAGLDGENYGFYLSTLYTEDRFAEDIRQIECTSPPSPAVTTENVFSPALLLRTANENPRLPVRVYVYSVP